jgi:nucleoside-diphosphate-sugar epimerase
MVYGDFQDQVTEDYVCRPIGQYGIMKLTGEDIVKDYHRRGAFDYAIIRPSAVYGPLDVEDRVVAKFMLTAMRGGILCVNGAGETLDFTYVDDAADGITSAATCKANNMTYNITKSHSVSLLQGAEMIVNIVGQGTIECRDRDADFPSRGALNIDRARSVLGYNPKIDVEEGFQKYYEWLSNSLYWQEQLRLSADSR